MSEAITYIFLVWTLLILASVVFGYAVGMWAEKWTEGNSDPSEEEP